MAFDKATTLAEGAIPVKYKELMALSGGAELKTVSPQASIYV